MANVSSPTISERAALEAKDALPYAPSWVDRLTAWAERLRGPAWIYYLVACLLCAALYTAFKWMEGTYPVGTLNIYHVFTAAAPVILIGMMHYLDRAAGRALAQFRPALDVAPEEYEVLHYELTTMPARLTWLFAFVGVFTTALFVVMVTSSPDHAQLQMLLSGPGYVVDGLLIFTLSSLSFVLMFHCIHQLGMVNTIYTQKTAINLFRLGPLYALSRFTALTAASVTFLAYAAVAATPTGSLRPFVNVAGIASVLLSLVVFITPLWGVHRLLNDAKGHLLSETSLRMEALIAQIHAKLDAGDLSNMDGLNKAMTSLTIEHDTLARIPTWPWQPETPRILFTAVMVPVVLWLLQRILERIVTP